MRRAFTLIELISTRKRGFTLIELLVVVSIIALLVAILLPVLSNVKYSVRTTQCASRLKQMGIAVTAYTVDNSERYPHKMDPGSTTHRSPFDGELYREDRKPWVIATRNTQSNFDYVPLIENYVSDLSEIFICPHLDFDWEEAYRPSTNATEIPYAMYWGIVQRLSGGSVARPAVDLGDGFGPNSFLLGGGIDADSRYRILASDKARLFPVGGGVRKLFGNHPPTGGDYELAQNQSNGLGRGYEFADTTTGNANYLYDDGSVQLYGQIRRDTIGNNADNLFRNAGDFWLAPTDRVE